MRYTPPPKSNNRQKGSWFIRQESVIAFNWSGCTWEMNVISPSDFTSTAVSDQQVLCLGNLVRSSSL